MVGSGGPANLCVCVCGGGREGEYVCVCEGGVCVCV